MQLELFPDEDRLLLKEKLSTLTDNFDDFVTNHYKSKEKFKEVSSEERFLLHFLKLKIIEDLNSLET